MAFLHPTTPPHGLKSMGEYAEVALLNTLEVGLSNAYTLFHSVDWSRGSRDHEQHGEIDIVIVNQAGDVLLVEVKAGEVDFAVGAIFKHYASGPKDVTRQVGLQYGAMRSRLEDAGLRVDLHHLLVLPNFHVQSETAQWPRERIVDCSEMPQIVSRIGDELGPGLPNSSVQQRVVAFFANHFHVQPDVSALVGRLQQTSTRLSSGLATWVPRICAPSGVLRVIGTAGSGKTQLALQLLREADSGGKKAAYLCFNRALADHMSLVAPVRTTAETFHEFAVRVVKRAGHTVDFSLPSAFDVLAAHCIELLDQSAPDLDLIVLDEMQDMQPDWVQALLSRLKVSGKAVVMEDPEQQLYKDRVAFDIPDAVTITCYENFRTPRALVTLINALRLTDVEVEALSPHAGEVADPIVYESPERIAPCTVQAVERCLSRGFALEDIAVVSMRGRERSVLQGLDMLGKWSLKHFTGVFDAGSAPIWKDGQLLIESVRRFKGQAAPAVVLTECDIGELDPLNRRLLFVGLTRARVHLEWVMSAQTSKVITQ